jgi:hypothetical protein
MYTLRSIQLCIVDRKISLIANMKHLLLSVSAFILLAIAGCAYHNSTYNDGFDFPIENVSQIIIGKTTDNELITMFGGPLEKSEVSENEERWEYSYSSGTKIEESFLTDEVHSTGHYKTLDILLKNGTVTNFTYTESSESRPARPASGSIRRKKNRSYHNSSRSPLILWALVTV